MPVCVISLRCAGPGTDRRATMCRYLVSEILGLRTSHYGPVSRSLRACRFSFYGQLFAARGKYDHFELLRDRDTLHPVAAWPKQYDFAFSRFQTNTVIRWEYLPGSVLYVVWSQSRSTRDDSDAFDLAGLSAFDQSTSRQFTNTFAHPPVNVLLIKFSYKFLNWTPSFYLG